MTLSIISFLALLFLAHAVPRRLCGEQLDNALMSVCHGMFNGIAFKKRGGDVFKSLALIHRLLPRGVVDRCCKKHCRIHTLREYCA